MGVERFIKAQEWQYADALSEIKNGRKTGHWIWYIFPQLHGLGRSEMCEIYGIRGRVEAEEYLKDSTLSARLREISGALLAHKDMSAMQILGGIDAQKVCSCMTLFDAVEPNSIFAEVLDAFYGGKRCQLTLKMI